LESLCGGPTLPDQRIAFGLPAMDMFSVDDESDEAIVVET
jgi:hypothetical protein